LSFKDRIYCTQQMADSLNVSYQELSQRKKEEALAWCVKYEEVCHYCSNSNILCDFQETKTQDYMDCLFADRSISLRVDLCISNKPMFLFHPNTNVRKGVFNIRDGCYIPEGTLVRIYGGGKKYDQRVGYVSHPIIERHFGSTGNTIRGHYIYMTKQETAKDYTQEAIDFIKDGIICSCDRDAVMIYQNSSKMLLECLKETEDLKRMASLHYYNRGDSSFYYSPNDVVLVEILTGGGWNNYFKVGYIDEAKLIWSSLDLKTRKLIDYEEDTKRQIGKVELLYHKGEPTEFIRKQEEYLRYIEEHPVKTTIARAINTKMVPSELLGWFIYVFFMTLVSFTYQRVTAWALCTMLWLVVRSSMRDKYIYK